MEAGQQVPGTGETTSQNDDQNVLEDTPARRKKIAKAAKRLAEIAQERESLSADKRAVLEDLVADGISRKAVERAVKDCQLDPEKLERQDHWYRMTRSALGKPIQGELDLAQTTH